jgi:hypothetical protein
MMFLCCAAAVQVASCTEPMVRHVDSGDGYAVDAPDRFVLGRDELFGMEVDALIDSRGEQTPIFILWVPATEMTPAEFHAQVINGRRPETVISDTSSKEAAEFVVDAGSGLVACYHVRRAGTGLGGAASIVTPSDRPAQCALVRDVARSLRRVVN